jgi:hypothetical protein
VANHALCRELSRHIFATLGAFPEGFGKVGLTHRELQRKVKVQVGKDRSTKLLCAGEIKQPSGDYVGLLMNVGTQDRPDYLLVFGTLSTGSYEPTGDVIFAVGIRFEWADETDDGSYYTYHDGMWVPIGLAQKLQIASMFEQQMQEGVPWTAPKSYDKFYELLGSLLDVDEEVDSSEQSE